MLRERPQGEGSTTFLLSALRLSGSRRPSYDRFFSFHDTLNASPKRRSFINCGAYNRTHSPGVPTILKIVRMLSELGFMGFLGL